MGIFVGAKKRGLIILFSLVLVILISSITYSAITSLTCTCSIFKDTQPVGITSPSGTDSCSASCYDSSGYLVPKCKAKGTYFLDMVCTGGSTISDKCDTSPNICLKSGSTAIDSLTRFPLDITPPGCTTPGNETCFNGDDDDCDDLNSDANQSRDKTNQNTYCVCGDGKTVGIVNNIGLMNPLTGNTDICAVDYSKPIGERFDWKYAEKEPFKIYSFEARSGDKVNLDVISTGKKWYTCNINDRSDLTIIQPSKKTALCKPIVQYIRYAVGEVTGEGLRPSLIPDPDCTCTSQGCGDGCTPTTTCVKSGSVVSSCGYVANPNIPAFSGLSAHTYIDGPKPTNPFPKSEKLGDGWVNTRIPDPATGGTFYDHYEYYSDAADYACPVTEGITMLENCDKTKIAPSCTFQINLPTNYGGDQLTKTGSSFPAIGAIQGSQDSDGGLCSDVMELASVPQLDPTNRADDDQCSGNAGTNTDGTGSGDSLGLILCNALDPGCTLSSGGSSAGAYSSGSSESSPAAYLASEVEALNYIYDDINSSFICYDELGKNSNIAECCSNNICFNQNLMFSSYPKAFGNGGITNTIRNYDSYSGSVNNVAPSFNFDSPLDFGYNSSVNPSYSLEFDILLPNITLTQLDSITINVSTSNKGVKIKDYTNGLELSTKRWRHISIPFTAFTNQGVSQITKFSLKRGNFQIAIDNVYINTGNNYYCSAYFGKWVNDLDPFDSNNVQEYLPKKYACNAYTTMSWTGNFCCGDKKHEFGIGLDKACYNSITVNNGDTLKNASNLDAYRDLLYYNSSVSGNKFYQCFFKNNDAGKLAYINTLNSAVTNLLRTDQIYVTTNSLGNSFIQAVNECKTFPNVSYFCDFNNNWNNASVKSYNSMAQTFLPETRTIYSSIELYSNFPNRANLTNHSSCCPTGFCWDGKTCIDGRSNTTQKVIPPDYIYNIIGDEYKAYICSEGTWSVKEVKYSPHNDFSSFCWDNNQCYYKGSIGEKCYNSGEFVKTSTDERLDYYCSNGSWYSNTLLLFNQLNKIGNASQKPYTVYCDTFDKVLNNDMQDSSWVEFNNYLSYSLEADDEKQYTSCALVIDNNDDGIFGSLSQSGINDLVYLGFPLKTSWGKDESFSKPISICSNSNTLLGNDKNTFIKCDISEDQGTYYYNNFTNTIILTKHIRSILIPNVEGMEVNKNIFTKMIDWIQGFFKSFFNKNTIIESDMSEAINLKTYFNNSYSFNNYLNNHIYYYNSNNGAQTKQIKAVVEYKKYGSNMKYLAYANYLGFNLDYCDVFTGADGDKSTSTPPGRVEAISGDQTRTHCDENSTSVSQVMSSNDYYLDYNYFKDLSAKTRPKKEGFNPNTVIQTNNGGLP